MKKVFFILVIAIFAISCQKSDNATKDDPTPVPEVPKKECEINNTCIVNFTSTGNDPYYFYWNGNLQYVIPGKGAFKLTAKAGISKYRLLQKSGYVIYPTDINGTITTAQCKEYSVTFPDKK